MLNLTRRRFLSATTSSIAAAWAMQHSAPNAAGDDPATNNPASNQTAPQKPAVVVDVGSGDELQQALNQRAILGGGIVRLSGPESLTCLVSEVPITRRNGAVEKSIHALLVPRGVELDLNHRTLRLDMRSNSYGVRLSSNSAIRNGTIKIVESQGKGSQAIWHSAVSVGAAYGDGGTVALPGHFSSVGNWRIEDLTIDQPFEAACIQLMSEAHQGVIRNIRILDSEKALLGIGLDWGTVGPIATADELVPQMRKLWDKHEISSTHPQHVLIENIVIGKLGRSADGNDAGVRCSGCHHITIRNIEIETAMAAVALFGGDFGFEFAPDAQRSEAHKGYLVENVKIQAARLYGLVLNGAEDNVYRSQQNFGYQPLRDPVHPGLDHPVFRNVVARGTRAKGSRGVYIASATDALFEDVDVENFEIGFSVNQWVQGLTFRYGRIANNKKKINISSNAESKDKIRFESKASK